MSEFFIERAADAPETSRGVDSSGAADADGGGGTTFLFHGGGDDGKDEKKKPKRPPIPIGPPVELTLSTGARMDLGADARPGDFGSIGGLVLPPAGISKMVERSLDEAKALSAADSAEHPPESSPTGSLLNIKA